MKRVPMLFLAIILVATLVSGAVACGSSPTATPVVVVATPTPGVQATPTPAAETLLIGNLSILSGAGSGFGFSASRGVERGIEIWNEGGGVVAGGKRYNLKIDTYDWGYSADTGRTAAEKAINDGARILFGIGTGNTAGAQQATEPNKVLLLAQTVSDELTGPKYPYTFRILTGATDQYSPAIEYIQKTYPDKKKIFVTIWNDATGKLVWDTWKPTMEKMGWTKLDFQFYEPGTTDFAPFVNSYLIPANDDIFVLISRTGEAGNLVKAARQFGFKGIITWVSGAGSVAEMKVAGDLADGVIIGDEWDWNGPFVPEAAKPEALKYISKFGTNPSLHFVTALEATKMLAAALKKAGSPDTTALKDALPTVTWESYMGGTGKLYPVGTRQGATFNFGAPVSVYDAKKQALVNVSFALPSSLK